jgi:hypothetical protein
MVIPEEGKTPSREHPGKISSSKAIQRRFLYAAKALQPLLHALSRLAALEAIYTLPSTLKSGTDGGYTPLYSTRNSSPYAVAYALAKDEGFGIIAALCSSWRQRCCQAKPPR